MYIWSFICVVQCLVFSLQVLLTGSLSVQLLFLDVGRTHLLRETVCLWGYRQADLKLREMQPPKTNCLALVKSLWVGAGNQLPNNPCFNLMGKIVNLIMARACYLILLVSMWTRLNGPLLCLAVVQARYRVPHPSLEPPEHSSAFSGPGLPECSLAAPRELNVAAVRGMVKGCRFAVKSTRIPRQTNSPCLSF